MNEPDNFMSWVPDSEEIIQRNRREMGGGSVMVHGIVASVDWIKLSFPFGKMNGQKYEEMLINIFETLEERYDDFIFQHDRASIHSCKIVKEFLNLGRIKVLMWLTNSPDLNIMDNIWQIMSNIVYNGPQFTQKENLIEKIMEAANIIMANKAVIIAGLYSGYSKRLINVIKSNENIL